ncbi:hypothetical protein COU58_00880 [Candidatus Pacearchaeota archaeon CG10_big_fil_rev_8_21_14_0_10_32_42]|nr:MAG: hypothetical protein COU58_00880 [Candidatus Pacearchaeota archaeon CG10_big_fil_rev_8_21_14_0_10_32_42]
MDFEGINFIKNKYENEVRPFWNNGAQSIAYQNFSSIYELEIIPNYKEIGRYIFGPSFVAASTSIYRKISKKEEVSKNLTNLFEASLTKLEESIISGKKH